MSTFEGRMKEYRLVSLDRFNGENLSSTVYFLSHMHTDHTVGLDQVSFFSRLKQRGDCYLYCSTITRILLLDNKKYGHLAPYVISQESLITKAPNSTLHCLVCRPIYLKPLETLCPTTIDIPAACDKNQNTTVLVTLLPAAHCLGSVMFLFEGDEGNVLYTGDFRWGMSEATKMPCLDPRSKPLRSIYVDTTFCFPKAFYIPSREQCESGVISLVKSHFQEYGSNGHVWIESRTNFGHEILLKELSLHMKMKIHVVLWKKLLYDQIPGLENIFTENAEETRIHAHPQYKRLAENTLPCGYVPPNNMNLMKIRPSTMWFTMIPEIVNIVQPQEAGWYRACYSFHSSYAEIRDLIQYLKPARVFPNVIPYSKKLDEIQDILNSFLSTPHYGHFSSVESVDQPLGIMKIPKASVEDSVSVGDCAFDDTLSQSRNSQEETSIQNSQSSYEGSCKTESELDLYSDEESKNSSQTSAAKDEPKMNSLPLNGSLQSSCSLPDHIEDNSDDSEYEEEMFLNEKSVGTSVNLPENKFSEGKDEEQKIKDLLGPSRTLKSDASPACTCKSPAKDNYKEHTTEQRADTSNSRYSCNGQADEEEEIGAKKSRDKIDLRKIFGSPNSFFEPLINSESSNQICQNQNVSAMFVSSKNLEDDCSEPEMNVLRQTSDCEINTDDQKESPAGDAVNSHESFNGNSVDSYNTTEEKAIEDDKQREDQKEVDLVTEQKVNCSLDLKIPELEGRLFASTLNKRHKTNNEEEECSQMKSCKIDLSLNSMKRQSHRIPSKEMDNVKVDTKKESLQMKMEVDITSKSQDGNSSKEKLITLSEDFQLFNSNASGLAVSVTNETLGENKKSIKCDDKPSFNKKNRKNNQSLNLKDRILNDENCQSSFGNQVPPIDSSSDISGSTHADIKLKKSNVAREIKLSQESTKSDVSIEIIKEISKKEKNQVVEISDSDNDDCIAIDFDSDRTLPPSPGILESPQELFSPSNAITDLSNVCDSSDNDGVVIIETVRPIQNGGRSLPRKRNSIIQLD